MKSETVSQGHGWDIDRIQAMATDLVVSSFAARAAKGMPLDQIATEVAVVAQFFIRMVPDYDVDRELFKNAFSVAIKEAIENYSTKEAV